MWAPWGGPSFYSLTVPYCPVILIIYMLGCVFFILLIAYTHILVFRTAMCFLAWIFSHMWISSDMWMLFHVFSQSSICFQSDNYPHLVTRLCHLFTPRQSHPSAHLTFRGPLAVGLGSDTDLQGGLILHFPAKLCRHFPPIWPSSYLYCKDRASGPYQNGYFNHLLFDRQIRDFMCSW